MTRLTNNTLSIFPSLPRDIPFVDKNGNMSNIWLAFFDALVIALQSNYSTEGLAIPQQPTTNITLLTGAQSTGSIIYDSTVPVFKGNVAGTWKTFTLT